MAKGNEVIVSSPAYGRRLEGIISNTGIASGHTLVPGICMQIEAAVEPDAGRHTFCVYNPTGLGAGGAARQIIVLNFDYLQGKVRSDAYTSGDRGLLYCPLNGDELNMVIQNISGTADDYAIGDLLQVFDTTGKLEDADSGTGFNLSAPFVCMETVTDPTADYYAHVMFTGY